MPAQEFVYANQVAEAASGDAGRLFVEKFMTDYASH